MVLMSRASASGSGAGAAAAVVSWTGQRHDKRGLQRTSAARPRRRPCRADPAAPAWILRAHVNEFGPAEDGGPFRNAAPNTCLNARTPSPSALAIPLRSCPGATSAAWTTVKSSSTAASSTHWARSLNPEDAQPACSAPRSQRASAACRKAGQ